MVMVAAVVLILSGCIGSKPEQDLYTIFEKAATQEKSFSQQASTFESLGQKDKDLYAKILQQGKDNNSSVQPIITEALQVLDQREKALDSELDVLKNAQKEMKDADSKANKISDPKLKEQAKKVEKLYNDRYNSFTEMYDSYKKAFQSEKSLYSMLENKDEKLKAISDKVKETNGLYKDAEVKIDQFNNLTNDYNKEKMDFYKAANINVK